MGIGSTKINGIGGCANENMHNFCNSSDSYLHRGVNFIKSILGTGKTDYIYRPCREFGYAEYPAGYDFQRISAQCIDNRTGRKHIFA